MPSVSPRFLSPKTAGLKSASELVFDQGDFYIAPIKGFHADSVAIEKSHTNQGMTPELQDANGSFDPFPENPCREALRDHDTFIRQSVTNGAERTALWKGKRSNLEGQA